MRNGTPQATCHRTAFDEVECRIPYSPGLIAAWKEAIPYSRRSYDPQTKAWRFWGSYQDLAVELLLARFPDALVPRREQTHATHPGRNEVDPLATLHLLPSAPAELVEAAFRCLARIHHPDVGGDPAAMRRLNEAHDALSRRLSA